MNLEKIQQMIREGTNEDICVAVSVLKCKTLKDIKNNLEYREAEPCSPTKTVGLGVKIRSRKGGQYEDFYRQLSDDLYMCIGPARLIFRDKDGLNDSFTIKEL